MQALPRESSFMPKIKCSMCAADIEISLMGDHVCQESAPMSEPTPPPDSSASFDQMPYNSRSANGNTASKPGRQMLPRVDTGAANRPFFKAAEQMTPVSASPSRTGSPFQAGGYNSSFDKPQRTAAMSMQRPPSPELATPLDSPFPPFPNNRSQSRPRTPQPPRPMPRSGGYGGLETPREEKESMFAPVSPRSATNGGLLQRMNTIAPGPFDLKVLPSAGAHQRTRTAGSLKEIAIPPSERPGHTPAGSISSINSRGSSSSNERSRATAPRAPRKNGYGGFGAPAGSSFDVPALSSDGRAHTFPKQSQSQDPRTRRPSEVAVPDFGPDVRPPSNDISKGRTSPPRGRRTSSGRDTSRAPPPRGVSLIRPRNESRIGDAPPLPSNINLAAEFGVGNPYHTPSESTSSNESETSEASKISSRSSPPTTSPARSIRNPSDTSNIDLLMSEIQSSMSDLQSKELTSATPSLTISTATPVRPGTQKLSMASSYAAQEPKPLATPYGVQEPKAPVSTYGVQEPKASSYGVQEPLLSPESPTDPTVQDGRLSPIPRTRNASRTPPPLERTTTGNTTASARRPGTSKGICKHCKLPIKQGQKSVSSADGRLTGRYHKTCFSCTTCLEPFSTSEFYVINDAPYCDRHYHKLNGSMCTSCDKGIEGQYLESERREKFHPGCLTCADCRRSLKHDYFEMNGRVYCERDAFRRTQQQQQGGRGGFGGGLNVPGSTNRMQRRTTRLMMM